MSTESGTKDPLWAELTGPNIVEASAGTGKTFTISGLYLRLVLEAQWQVSEILVITFTVAATEELRDRIRRRLETAREALAARTSDDPFIHELTERIADPKRADWLLQRALHSFDQAAIFTIHGFCQRALADHAFEAGQPFDLELMPDADPIIQEVCNDFWRREMQGVDSLFAEYLTEKELSPKDLKKSLEPYLGKPYVAVRPPDPPADCEDAASRYLEAFEELRKLWLEEQAEIQQELMEALPGLNKNQYNAEKVESWFQQLQETLQAGTPPLQWFDKAEKLGSQALVRGTKKNEKTPCHQFFEVMDQVLSLCAPLINCLEYQRKDFLYRALFYAWEEVPRRKASRGAQSFDDLLLNLEHALNGESGDQLATSLRRCFPVALIDEFQDTDPIQYRIIRRIYWDTKGPVFLVGDPKQAIYAFRGADVFAYLQARGDVENYLGVSHELPFNWRSVEPLVRSFNALFSRVPCPFWFEAIPYRPVEPGDANHKELVLSEEFNDKPFQWWFLSSDPESGKPINKDKARGEGARAAALEIARLLAAGKQGQAGFRNSDGHWESLSAGHIAVLVRTHRSAEQVRKALSRHGIPCAEHAQQSVYHTSEAEAFERVLTAIADPSNESLLMGALSTPFHGYTGEELFDLACDEEASNQLLEYFHDLQDRWRESGFIVMFRQWLAEMKIRNRILALPQGERRLTNLLHLGELLQRQAVESDIAPEGVLQWLASRRQSSGKAGDEEQLRLESDENLVQLVTFHKSKGLEYPVVVCPFLWDLPIQKSDQDDLLAFHDVNSENQLALDLRIANRDEAQKRCLEEEFAEKLRLLYVAVTRATHRIYAVTGRINELDKSALGYLLHLSTGKAANVENLSDLKPIKNKPNQELRNDLDALSERHPDSFAVQDLDVSAWNAEEVINENTGVPELSHRLFNGSIKEDRRVTSFSALIRSKAEELPHLDPGEDTAAEAVVPVEDEEPSGIALFPRGPRAGRCLHAVVENVDFTRDRKEWLPTVQQTLGAFGYASDAWDETVTNMLESVVATPLGGDFKDGGLAAIGPGQRKDELEFYYPLARLTPQALNKVLAKHGYQDDADSSHSELDFKPLEGYMRGFIDLVFMCGGRYFLADYKSDWLGPSPASYDQQALGEAMYRHGYVLQYLIYSVALHRFLGQCLVDYDYEAHFGGVYYLFLRGMDPETGTGVYCDRPDWRLINELDRLFCGEI